MIHTYTLFGRHIIIDTASGAVHEADAATLALLSTITPPMQKEPPPALCEQDKEIWAELYGLYEDGMLFSDETRVALPTETPLKAICLHVAHDCNLRCRYCFAETGSFGAQRGLMNKETAERAVDFLLSRCGGRKNLEIDFFGGEPLLALDTVKHTVNYARTAAPDKRFRFTITTNGIALDDDSISFINAEMDNVVLSLDGRADVNDRARPRPNGKGSYDAIVPRYKQLVESRAGDYFIRGTYTTDNLDFYEDILHMAKLGFENISVEPVVLTPGHKLALTQECLPELFGEYEKLTAELEKGEFSFFHFNIDLEQGPCLYKRLRGCGAGYEYAAIAPDGEVYPCHQFVGKPEYKMGDVFAGGFDEKISASFSGRSIYMTQECASCWVKYYCSGGCAAGNLTVNGDMDKPDELTCALERKRLECAIYLKIVEKSGFEAE